MRVWVEVNIDCIECGGDNAEPVQGIWTNYESAMMHWSGLAADAEKRDGRVSESGGVYFIDYSDHQVRLQEVEL